VSVQGESKAAEANEPAWDARAISGSTIVTI